MEFPELGQHCWFCRRLDFLPLKCDACQELFCKDHIIYSQHKCSSAYKKDVQVPVCPLCNIPVPIRKGETPDVAVGAHMDRDCRQDSAQQKQKILTHKCFQAGCRKKEMMRLVCDQCHQNFCLHHRHPLDHQCPGRIWPISKAGCAAIMRSLQSKNMLPTVSSYKMDAKQKVDVYHRFQTQLCQSYKSQEKLMKAEKKKHLSPEKRKMKQKKKSAKHPKLQMAPEEDEPVLKKHKLNVRKEEEEETKEELSPEEKRILERKLKKERKKAQKKLTQEAMPGAKKNQPKKPSGWSGSPQGWKFQKTRQTWLLLHMYDEDQVPDQYFSILLRYLEGLQGRARDTTVQKAEALMKEYDQSNVEDDLLEGKRGRIRKVLQLLS